MWKLRSASHTPSLKDIVELCHSKFFGTAGKRDPQNLRTDQARGKNYREPMDKTYRSYGVEPDDVIRVICIRAIPGQNTKYQEQLNVVAQTYGLRSDRLRLLSFRDEVVPQLKSNISTANYDDLILRVVSLLAAAEKSPTLPSSSNVK